MARKDGLGSKEDLTLTRSRQLLDCLCSRNCVGGLQELCDVTEGAGRAKRDALMVAGTLPTVPSAVQSSCLFTRSEWGGDQPLSC